MVIATLSLTKPVIKVILKNVFLNNKLKCYRLSHDVVTWDVDVVTWDVDRDVSTACC